VTIVERSLTLSKARPFFDEVRRHERFGHPFLRAVSCRAWLAVCHAELGGSQRVGLGTKAPDCRGVGAPLEPRTRLLGSWSSVPPSRRPAQGPPPTRTGYGHLSGSGPPIHFLLGGCGLGRGIHPWPGVVADAVSLLTQALEQTITTEVVDFQVLCSLPLGEAQMLSGRLERHTPSPSAPWHSPVNTSNVSTRRMPCASLARSRRGASPGEYEAEGVLRTPAPRSGRGVGHAPLQAHCHHGLGTLYAQTGQREQARAALTAALALYRDMDMTSGYPRRRAALARVEGLVRAYGHVGRGLHLSPAGNR